MLRNLARQKRRKNIRKMDLLSTFEVASRQFEVLAHHTELDILRAENLTELAHRFLGTHVRTGIARSVVSRQQQLEFFAGLPAFAFAEDPCGFGMLNVGADPSLKNV